MLLFTADVVSYSKIFCEVMQNRVDKKSLMIRFFVDK